MLVERAIFLGNADYDLLHWFLLDCSMIQLHNQREGRWLDGWVSGNAACLDDSEDRAQDERRQALTSSAAVRVR
jgi:hypothetical protein